MTAGFRTPLIAAIALVVAVALGYWAYGTRKSSDAGKTALALAQETARNLQDALVADPARPSSETTQAIGDYAAAASRNLEALKRLNARGSQPLVDALDDFLLTSREMLARQAAGFRARRQLLGSTQALREHMRADNRTGAWVKEAVQHKERVEKDFRDFQGAAEALDKLYGSFPTSVARVASRSRTAPLVEEKLVAEARKRWDAALKQAADEVEKIRQFTVPR